MKTMITTLAFALVGGMLFGQEEPDTTKMTIELSQIDFSTILEKNVFKEVGFHLFKVQESKGRMWEMPKDGSLIAKATSIYERKLR